MSRGKYIDVVSWGSIVLALMALAVSIRGCQVSQRALDLSQDQYKQDRSLILIGEFDSKDQNILDVKVRPIDNGMVFLDGKANFPTDFFKEPIPIDSHGRFMYMGDVTLMLRSHLERKFSKIKDTLQLGRANMPVVIDSYYAVKGGTYSDRSLYVLRFNFVIYPEKFKETLIEPQSLVFVTRYSPNLDIDMVGLNQVLKGDAYIDMPVRSP